MNFLALTLMLSLLVNIDGQQPSLQRTSDERAQQVMRELESEKQKLNCNKVDCSMLEAFLDALKEGQRGDGIHYTWMDKMRQLGIKQAFFLVHYSWKNRRYNYKVEEVAYFQQYYLQTSKIKNGSLLNQIRKSGLEKELREAIIARIKKYEQPYKPEYAKEGESYHYLLDDEYLPVIGFVT